MDFGLARLTEASRLTKPETTLGTVAYMSPEQLQGAATDHRSDIWSLGVVLYEMVTGLRPFKGEYDQALGYEIVNENPEPLTAVRAGVPMELEFLTAKCLEKDADKRYGSATELAVDLTSAAARLKSGQTRSINVSRVAPEEIQPAPAPEPKQRPWLLGVLVGVISLAFLALAAVHFNEAPLEVPLRRFALTPPVRVGTGDNADTPVVISPNGKHIAFIEQGSGGRLWVQDLDQLDARVIEGTEGAYSPFWSPDSEVIGFAVGEMVKKVPVQGGLASQICELPGGHFHGPSWSPDGEVIVFGSGTPHSLHEVAAIGGTPRELIAADEIEPSTGAPVGAVYWSQFLPPQAGARVVVLAFQTPAGRTIAVQDLASGRRTFLGPGSSPSYSPSGHLVFQSTSTTNELWVLPFSLQTLNATGEAFPLVAGSRNASIAADQTLVYLDSPDVRQRQLVWRNRTGEKVGEIGQPQQNISHPVLSPDGRRVAVAGVEPDTGNDVWIHEVDRPVKRRLTFDLAQDGRPQWSPSGLDVTFQSNRGGIADIFRRAADGTGEAELLAATEANGIPYGWSRDGDYLVYTSRGEETNTDLWYLNRKDDEDEFESIEFLATPFRETAPNLSPDGRFVAYCSNASGEFQVYVRPFPFGDGQWQVSETGGCQPRWSRDGSELFFVDKDTLVAVELTTSPSFATISTTVLFSDPGLVGASAASHVTYDVAADGRFVLKEFVEDAEPELPVIRVVQNWYEEFRERDE
jgi:Tol biopolymer transport system component